MVTRTRFLIVIGSFSLLLWLSLIFYGFFLGGNPMPGYERMVPIAYVGIMVIGLFGGVLGLVGFIKGKKSLILLASLFGLVGSIPLFLLELSTVGIIFLLISIIPLIGLFRGDRKDDEGIDI